MKRPDNVSSREGEITNNGSFNGSAGLDGFWLGVAGAGPGNEDCNVESQNGLDSERDDSFFRIESREEQNGEDWSSVLPGAFRVGQQSLSTIERGGDYGYVVENPIEITEATRHDEANQDTVSQDDDDHQPTAIEAELAPDVDGIVEDMLRRREERLERQIVTADIVVTFPLTKANLMLPKFSKEQEARFQQEHSVLVRELLKYTAPFIAWCIFIPISWDAVQPGSNILASLFLRTVGALSALLLSICSRYNFFLIWAQPILLILYTIIASVYPIIFSLVQDGFVMGVGWIGCCLLASATIGLLQARYALVHCGIILMITNVLMILDNKRSSLYSLRYVLLSCNIFMVVITILALPFSYVLELHLRHRFRDTGTIFRWTNKDNKATSSYESSMDEYEEV